jgi:hypothetical protein
MLPLPALHPALPPVTPRMAMTIRVTGWRAFALLVAMAAFGLWRAQAQRRTLDTEARRLVQIELSAEYLRGGNLVPSEVVELRSLTARGHGERVVVRAEVTVQGRTPPDGESVRYFAMRHRLVGGWELLPQRADAFSYYTTLW